MFSRIKPIRYIPIRLIHIPRTISGRNASPKSINPLEYATDSVTHRIISVVGIISRELNSNVYGTIDHTMDTLISTNIPFLESHFQQNSHVFMESNKRDFQSIFDDNKESQSQIIKQLINDDLDKSYNLIKKKRLGVHRFKAPKSDYVTFVKFLYPNAGQNINHNRLIDAYSSLPSPHPLYIEPYDLEELLSAFSKSRGKHRSENLPYLLHVIKDMRNVGLELSTSEKNNVLYLQYYSMKNTLSPASYRVIRDQFSLIDISSFNILLNFAILGRDEELFKEIKKDLDKRFVSDRFTLNLMMTHYANINDSEQFLDTLDSFFKSFTVDIVTYNNIIQGFLNLGLPDISKELFDILISSNSSREITSLSTDHERRVHNRKMKALDRLTSILAMREPFLVQLSPTSDTFSIILKGYTSDKTCSFDQIDQVLSNMEIFGVPLKTKDLIYIFKRFGERFDSGHENGWDSNNLNKVTSMFLKSVTNNTQYIPIDLCISLVDAFINKVDKAYLFEHKQKLVSIKGNLKANLSVHEFEYEKGNVIYELLKDACKAGFPESAEIKEYIQRADAA